MTRFEAGDIVRVPFPHIERNVRRYRPALVVTKRPIGPDDLLIWVAMITNARRAPWPGDVPISDHKAAGLPIPSTVRTAKLATLEASGAEQIGKLDDVSFSKVRQLIAQHLGLGT